MGEINRNALAEQGRRFAALIGEYGLGGACQHIKDSEYVNMEAWIVSLLRGEKTALRALSAEQPAKEPEEVAWKWRCREDGPDAEWHVSLFWQGAFGYTKVNEVIPLYALPSADPRPSNVAKDCQHGGDLCLAGQRDGVTCPEDSCDIDDGLRRPSERRVAQESVGWFWFDPQWKAWQQMTGPDDDGEYVQLFRLPAEQAECPACKGAGERLQFFKPAYEQDGYDEMRSCPDCDGTGWATERAAQQGNQASDLPNDQALPAVAALPQEEKIDADCNAPFCGWTGKVTNWKGAAPLCPECHGPVTVFDSPNPSGRSEFSVAAAPQEAAPKECVWMIFYDDQDKKPEIHTSEAAARHRYAEISMSWNAHLFAKVDSNSRDDIYAKHNRAAPQSAPRSVARFMLCENGHIERDDAFGEYVLAEDYNALAQGAPREAQAVSDELHGAANYAIEQLDRYVTMLDPSCECVPCPECGKMPAECSGTECSQTCSCNECDHCCGTMAVSALRAALYARPAPEGWVSVSERKGFYVASRVHNAPMWLKLRDHGHLINSSWIDEAGDGDTADFGELWSRIKKEIARSEALVIYMHGSDFPLKGALVEVGIALGLCVPVRVVLADVELEGRTLRPVGSWLKDWRVTQFDTLERALSPATPEPRERDEEYDCPVHGKLGGINECPRC